MSVAVVNESKRNTSLITKIIINSKKLIQELVCLALLLLFYTSVDNLDYKHACLYYARGFIINQNKKRK